MKSNKPKILTFTDWYLPGHKAGGPITSMANLVQQVGEDVEFKIACSDRDYMSNDPYNDIKSNTWTKIGNAEVFYFSPDNLSKSSIRKMIKQHPQHVVYINGIFSKYFSVTPLIEANKLNRKIIVAPRGMFAPGALGIKANKKRMFLNLAKFMGWYRQVTFHATNHEEAKQIQKIVSRRSKIHIIPNLPNLPADRQRQIPKTKNQIHVVSVARIAREKNTLFALELLKNIPQSVEVSFTLIGPVYDAKYFEKCKEVVGSLSANVKVEFKGAMTPSEIQSEWPKHHLLFLPTLGENYGHAIIEAMLNGLPVLISDKTPWKNLQKDKLGADFPLDSSKSFIDYILKIAAMDQEQYNIETAAIQQKAAEKLHINETISSYKEMFR